jgi:hypothetical protein
VRQGNQAIQVICTLVGPQDVHVAAHRPGTDGAAVGVRVGGALLHITDGATVAAFLMAWRAATRHGRDLPVRADPSRVPPISGTAIPAVFMEAADRPPAQARLERGRAGQWSRLWVTLGRMTFDVQDQEALVTTTAAFQRAARIAPGVFLPTPDQRALERTAAAAARLLATPPSRRPLRPGASSRTAPAPAQQGATPSPARPAPARAAAKGRTR